MLKTTLIIIALVAVATGIVWLTPLGTEHVSITVGMWSALTFTGLCCGIDEGAIIFTVIWCCFPLLLAGIGVCWLIGA